MDGFWWKVPLKWMIFGYPHIWLATNNALMFCWNRAKDPIGSRATRDARAACEVKRLGRVLYLSRWINIGITGLGRILWQKRQIKSQIRSISQHPFVLCCFVFGFTWFDMVWPHQTNSSRLFQTLPYPRWGPVAVLPESQIVGRVLVCMDCWPFWEGTFDLYGIWGYKKKIGQPHTALAYTPWQTHLGTHIVEQF